jgi:tetratricopeptide (TPR) repeat protein
MATKDLDIIMDSEQQIFQMPRSVLPKFPSESSVRASFINTMSTSLFVDKPSFLSWVDFTLEHPDEIWETEVGQEANLFHYIAFFGDNNGVPAFSVEVYGNDESLGVNDFCLIVNQDDLLPLRLGKLVYSRSLEWQRERLVRSLNEKALATYDKGKLEEARDLIDAAIRFSGHSTAYLFNNRGLICWKMGETDEAKENFRASIRLDDTNGDPYFNIGLIYFDEANYPQALHFLRRAVEIDPSDSQFLTELGHLYLELDREEEALALFREAFKNDPNDPQVDFHLGHYFLYKKRDPKHAVKYYEKGLKKDPQDQFALADLAVAHWIRGNRRKASLIHKMLQRSGQLMPYTISRLVYLNTEMGNYENALNYYQKALSHSEPFEPEWLHYNAAVIYAKTGMSKQALDILVLAVQEGGEAVVKRAMSDSALQRVTSTTHFKKLMKQANRRRNR